MSDLDGTIPADIDEPSCLGAGPMAPECDQCDLRWAQALKTGERLVEIAFKSRYGHGGRKVNPTVGYRQMDPVELKAFCIAAFEAGAQWESER